MGAEHSRIFMAVTGTLRPGPWLRTPLLQVEMPQTPPLQGLVRDLKSPTWSPANFVSRTSQVTSLVNSECSPISRNQGVVECSRFRNFGRDSLWEGIVWFGATRPPKNRSDQTADPNIISASRDGLLLPAMGSWGLRGSFQGPKPRSGPVEGGDW